MEYDALQSPSEAFRNVTSEEILKMIEENRYPAWADGESGLWCWDTHFVESDMKEPWVSVRTYVFQDLDMHELVFPPVFRLRGLLPRGCGRHSRGALASQCRGRVAGQRVVRPRRLGLSTGAYLYSPHSATPGPGAGLGSGACRSDSVSVVMC